MGAVNIFNNESNLIKNHLSGVYDKVSSVARYYKNHGIRAFVVGDDNYGEGSSREHSAMEPRHLGVNVVLVRSFARIHDINLKNRVCLHGTSFEKRLMGINNIPSKTSL
jgi:aconitate hydratase